MFNPNKSQVEMVGSFFSSCENFQEKNNTLNKNVLFPFLFVGFFVVVCFFVLFVLKLTSFLRT